jgi:GH18 family chitinase
MDGGYGKIANEDKLIDLVERAHAEKVKVLLSLGGGGSDNPGAFDSIAADPALTDAFVRSTISMMARYCLDGIDMDWEFPTAGNAAYFALLMDALSARLHLFGKELTIAVSATAFYGQYCVDSVIDDVDFLNIMAYDDGYGTPGVHHSTYWYARAAMDYWLIIRRVPQAKAILGLPFYGRSLKDRHSISYFNLLRSDPWASSADVSGEFGYNGFDTLRAKAVNLARARGGGIMIWQLNQDAKGAASLLNAIFDAVKAPLEPPEGKD